MKSEHAQALRTDNKYEERNNLPCEKIIAHDKRYAHIIKTLFFNRL